MSHVGNEDDINLRKIVVVGVVSLFIFAISAVIAALILNHDTAMLQETRGVAAKPTAIGQAEIGIMDTVEFDGDRRLEVWKKEMNARLTTYGWSDRAKGLIHIPIDKAMADLAGAQP